MGTKLTIPSTGGTTSGVVGESYWNKSGSYLTPKTIGDSVNLLSGGIKDNSTSGVIYISDVQTLLNNAITSISGEVTSIGHGNANSTISNLAVINKTLTGYSSTTGSISSSDSILTAIEKIDGNYAIRYNKITVVSPLAGTTITYNTLQDAFNSIPAATDNATARQVYTVYVPSGTYDEDVTVEINNRKIIMVCIGSVALGTLTGTAWGSGGTTRNFTITNNGTSTINSIRSGFAITSINSLTDGSTSHQSYLSKFRISGNLILTSLVGISSEFSLEVEVFGNLDASTYSGNCNVYLKNSRIRGTCGGTPFRLQNAYRSQFEGLVTCATYSLIDNSIFNGGFTTVSATPDLTPSYFLDCYLLGTFTGPAGSLRVNLTTDYYLTTNSVVLAGGATKILIANPASATTSGVLSNSDWTTFSNNSIASGTVYQYYRGDKTWQNLNITSKDTVANAELANYITNDIVYVDETKTVYSYTASGSAYTRDAKFILNTGAGGNTRLLGISGRYILGQGGTANGGVTIGTTDAFSRNQIWNASANASLRLGSLAQDGDPNNTASEGIVAYGTNSSGVFDTTNWAYARIKSTRIGINDCLANTQYYLFRADENGMYLKNNSTTTVYNIARSSGNTYTRGTFVAGGTSGTSTLSSLGSFSLPITTVTSDYSVTSNDFTILVDTTSNNVTVTLPTAVGITGRIYNIKRITGGGNSCNIVTTSSQTIDGSTSYSIAVQWPDIWIQSNGSNWYII